MISNVVKQTPFSFIVLMLVRTLLVESYTHLNSTGDITSIRIGHDNSGAGPAWYLEQVVILCEETNKQFMFYCDQWYVSASRFRELHIINCFRFAKDEDDGLIERELIAGEEGHRLVYVVQVHTGDKAGAGTDANVFIVLSGDKVFQCCYCYI